MAFNLMKGLHHAGLKDWTSGKDMSELTAAILPSDDVWTLTLYKGAVPMEFFNYIDRDEAVDDANALCLTLHDTYARVCNATGEGMNEGWIFEGSDMYFKYADDARDYANKIGYSSIQEAYDADECYYTEWEQDAHEHVEINGQII